MMRKFEMKGLRGEERLPVGAAASGGGGGMRAPLLCERTVHTTFIFSYRILLNIKLRCCLHFFFF